MSLGSFASLLQRCSTASRVAQLLSRSFPRAGTEGLQTLSWRKRKLSGSGFPKVVPRRSVKPALGDRLYTGSLRTRLRRASPKSGAARVGCYRLGRCRVSAHLLGLSLRPRRGDDDPYDYPGRRGNRLYEPSWQISTGCARQDRAQLFSAESGTACAAAWKPIFEWVPSQNGFLVDAPQRQSTVLS